MTKRFALPALRISIPVLMLFQVSALFLHAFVERHLLTAGIGQAWAQQVGALGGLLLLLVFIAPLLFRERQYLGTLFRPPESWLRLVTTAVLVGLSLRALWWCAMIAVASLDLTARGDTIAAINPMFWWRCPPLSVLSVTVLVLVLLTPVVEELISRGLVLTTLLSSGRTTAIPLSATLFAVLHKPGDIPYAFVFGVIVGFYFIHCRTLWGPILVHMTVNGMTIIDWSCLHGLWVPAEVSWLRGIAAGVCALMSLAGAYYLSRSSGAGAL